MSKKIYFSHDGGVDDLISLFLLLQMKEISLAGVSVMGADSYLQPAGAASRKIIDRFGVPNQLTVAYSNAKTAHPFPKEWRLDAYSENALPILNETDKIICQKASLPADEDLIQKLRDAKDPLTLLFTGPLSDLASALVKAPDIEPKIKELYWMGGTFLKRGNVMEPDSDGSQEWNAFWDPEAVKTVFDSQLKITMVALESTNKVPLTNEVRLTWAQNRRYPGLDFIGNSYAFVPELSLFETNSTYFLWDVLTTCLLADPSLGQTKEVFCDVSTAYPSAGKTYLTPKGRPVSLVYDVNREQFFDLILKLGKKAK